VVRPLFSKTINFSKHVGEICIKEPAKIYSMEGTFNSIILHIDKA